MLVGKSAKMNIDIAMTVKVLLVFIGIGLLVSLFFAYRSITVGKRLEFFKKRQNLVTHGWRLILFAIGLVIFGVILSRFGEPVAYRYFPPSPTITGTPTITLTPTVTLTPKDTLTPTITLTLAQTYTPSLPTEAMATIQTPIGPDAGAVFSLIQFSTKTKDGVVIDPVTTFNPPVTHIYGGFSYDKVVAGVHWTAVWYHEGKIFYLETKAWNYPPGGYGWTDCDLSSADWLPGEYEVQIFVGQTWKSSGRFTISGAQTSGTQTQPAKATVVPPTPSPSPSVTLTP